MRNPPKKLALALIAALSWGAAIAADAPAKPLKAGWDKKQVKVFAYACTDGLVTPTARDYKAAALADGVTLHKPFPEKEFRDSAFPMCLCIAQRMAETLPLAEVQKEGAKYSQPLINEALNGGRCKPDGMLGDILKKKDLAP